MIRIFGATDTSFISNGDVVLLPLKAKVHKPSAYRSADPSCGRAGWRS